MAEKYELRKPEERIEYLPEIALLPPISHKGQILDMALFGPNTYSGNLNAMQKRYFHSKQHPNISFREATISESISASAYRFLEFAKPRIFDERWLQSGRYVKNSEGIFTNTDETDDKVLRNMLDKSEKVGDIRFIDNKIAFVSYDKIEQGVQESRHFAEGNLARALEHTRGSVAKNILEISSNYDLGVNVFGFDSVETPVVRVVTLGSDRDSGYRLLHVNGVNWGDYGDGFAFGVL